MKIILVTLVLISTMTNIYACEKGQCIETPNTDTEIQYWILDTIVK